MRVCALGRGDEIARRLLIDTQDKLWRLGSVWFDIQRIASVQSCDTLKYRYRAGNARTTKVMGHPYVCIGHLISVCMA